jgi:excisionase family DNA binding protein
MRLRLITVRECSELLGLSEKSVRQRIAAGAIPSIRVGVRAIRIDLDALRQALPSAARR